MKLKKIFIIFTILILSGCYNYRELNEISIVSSIGIDKKDGEYLVSAQVMNAKSEKESESTQVLVYEGTGKSINEALRDVTTKSSRRLYGGHISKLVISEEIAKEGIVNVIDMFQRLTEIRNEFTITVSKNIAAADVIKVMTVPETIPAEYVKTSLESADIESALTYSTQLDEFVSLYLKKGIDPVIAVIEVKNYNEEGTTLDNTTSTDPETKIVLDYIAITEEGKLEDYLNRNETIGYNFIKNQVKEMIIPVKCDDNYYASISVLGNKTKTKIKKEDNKYIIKLDISTNANISEYNCLENITSEKHINELKKKTENKIKKYINDALEKQKDSKSKFLGLERQIYLEYPKYNNEDYEVEIDVNVDLKRKGEIRNSSKGEKE